MNGSYHNTTESTMSELKLYEHRANSQEGNILNWFREYPRLPHSPSSLQTILFYSEVPITSVRRALTNLTNSGDLVKTDRQVKGPYGRPEFQWRLADKYNQGSLF